MKKLYFAIIFLLSILQANAQKMPSDQLLLLEGQWGGDLVYLDYSSNKEVKIPVRVTIEEVRQGKYQFSYKYPNEPKANSKSKVSIDLEKGIIGGDEIEELIEQDNQLTIIAFSTGKDNGQKARFIKTYVIGEKSLSIKKEVQYESSNERFMRNEYRLKK